MSRTIKQIAQDATDARQHFDRTSRDAYYSIKLLEGIAEAVERSAQESALLLYERKRKGELK